MPLPRPPDKGPPAGTVTDNSAAAGSVELNAMNGGTSNALSIVNTSINGKVGDGVSKAEQPEGAEDDIMQLARLGDIKRMERLFEGGEYDATYADDEGITPLHWAAINNQYAMCRFLIQHGAPINRKGGESVSTPLQWAAQRSHYYTVSLLLQHGADPLITDSQGYNTLHISTFNGNVLLLVLLLHTGIPVDVLDAFGHTSLMWAAYKGFPRCVDLFLRWGANVHAVDEQGFTALHWALVKGSPACILKLLEYGADRFKATATGKTPAMTAEELKTYPAWHRALREAGYNNDGTPKIPGWPGSALLLQDRKGFISKFTFLWPSLLIFTELVILSGMPVAAGIPIAAVVGYGLLAVAQQVLEHAPADMRHFSRTPWMAGIFAGTLAVTGLNWVFTVLPGTWFAEETGPGLALGVGAKVGVEGDAGHPVLNMMFGVLFGLTAYFYVCAMTFDAGIVPKMKGIAEQRVVIEELIAGWRFDEENFCVSCMVRMPLRSKHCKKCKRCVARHDHHCPWVNNCIGVNNHRQFYLYVVSLAGGIIFYDALLFKYFSRIPDGAFDVCTLLPSFVCTLVNLDAYTLLLGIWISLQLLWVLMLLSVQTLQIARQLTTYESMFGIRSSTPSVDFTSTGVPLNADADADAVDSLGGSGGSHQAKKGSRGSCMSQTAMLLGITPFLETITGNTHSTSPQKKANPYAHGVVSNCKDFWYDPAPVFKERDSGVAMVGGQRVSYLDMYEVPEVTKRVRGYERVEAMA